MSDIKRAVGSAKEFMTYTRIERKDGGVIMRIAESNENDHRCSEDCFCEVLNEPTGDEWGGDTAEWYPRKQVWETVDPEWWDSVRELGGEGG